MMLRISPLRLNNRINFTAFPNQCFVNAPLSQYFKSQTNKAPKRTFALHSNPKIPKHFDEKISRRLDTHTSGPVGIVVQLIRDFFGSYDDAIISTRRFNYTPVEFKPVSVTENFDELQVPLDHVSRDPSDTYFLDQEYIQNFKELRDKYQDTVGSGGNGVYGRDLIDSMAANFGHSRYKLLPTHTTAHITKLLRAGSTEALYSGQVFRRDEIDSQHYPLFHQIDGYLLFSREEVERLRASERYAGMDTQGVILNHLKRTLEALVGYLYGFVRHVPKDSEAPDEVPYSDLAKKWDDEATFPFTSPSAEFYVQNGDELTEVLGCGVLKNLILENNFPAFGKEYVGGWAFGIGLERMAMVLCRIADIRQFWETDERFTRQYEHAYAQRALPVFARYSKNPPVARDVSFYVPGKFDEDAFKRAVVESGRGYVETVEFVSSYFNEALKKQSLCYRVVYRAFQENLTNAFVNEVHEDVTAALRDKLHLSIR